MAEAGTHDVVLLNSDTEVPRGWLTRLTAQAYAGKRIATVSPFSNNATICGYPDNQAGPIAYAHPLNEIDQTCRTVNAGRFVDLPTTVGFCMYIRREALRQVGEFDAERFTLGYGEENDFCLRATALGWQHRLACDTFVYHQGSVSFGDQTDQLSQRAMQLILQRYPSYLRDIGRHVGLDEAAPARFAVTAGLFRRSGLPIILMVVHELGGGVRRHIDGVMQRLEREARFLLLRATDRGAELSIPALPNHPVLTLPAERVDDMAAMLRSMNLSRVHIHHLIGMTMDVSALIRKLGVPFDTTVHDYSAICPQINLLPWRDSLYCNEPDIAACNACIANRTTQGARDIISWRADQAWQLRDAARVLCPSNDVLARLGRFGLDANAILAPHDPVEAAPWKLTITPPGRGKQTGRAGKFRIAVLGTLVDHKGGRTVASVAEMADPRTTQLHLIGDIDGAFSAAARNRIKLTGPYQDSELAGLIETVAPHLIWFPAVWPETFSYTLSAAIDAGIPIAATLIGAHAERLAGRPHSWLVDVATSPAGWIRMFAEIRAALSRTEATTTPIRPSVQDFYAADYLRPRPAPARRRKAKPRIAVLPERFDLGFVTPCGYIRLLQPLHHLAAAGDFEFVLATPESIFDHPAEIIVTQRSAMPDVATVNRLAAHARSVGATLVFDLDDDLLAIPRSHPEATLLRPRAAVARRMLDVADSVFLSTPGLAERLSSLRPDAVVMENGLDERIWTTPAPPSQDQPIRILCMGTTTHERDLAMIEPALLRLKAEYGERVVIDVVGMTSRAELPAGLNRLSPPANAMRSYPGFVNWLTSAEPAWHIGLAPLLDTAFNLGKSPIKAMDYAALGLAVLASDTPVYQGCIADGPAGQLVANDAASWYAALTWLLRNPEARRAIAARSRQAFLARASLVSQAPQRHRAWSRLLGAHEADAAA